MLRMAQPAVKEAIDPERVRALAEKLTGKNWRTVKDRVRCDGVPTNTTRGALS